MSPKTSLTLFHCLIGPALTLGGFALANRMSDRGPLVALGVIGAALVLPALIISRVAWAAGYTAGQRDAQRPAG